jgi:hypothetical protein
LRVSVYDTLWSALHSEYQVPLTFVEIGRQREALLVNLFFSSGIYNLSGHWA